MTKDTHFFLICPIGFEQLLIEELNYKFTFLKDPVNPLRDLDYKIVSQTVGGVEIATSLDIGLYLNRILKIPSRILLRLKDQKCRDLPKLYKILKKMNWKEYLRTENLSFKISAKKSRLIHTGKINDCAVAALADYFKANQIKVSQRIENPPEQLIFLRFQDDDLTISLDTSGDLLYKRSKQTFRGHAGIRENMAAALLLTLLDFKSYEGFTLLDPMCGSATLLREAQTFFKTNDQTFAYESWANTEFELFFDSDNPWKMKSFQGIEIDPEVVKKVSKNTQNLIINEGDFFKSSFQAPSILILNPPYGKRIKIPGKKTSYFLKIISHIKDNFGPKRFGMIIPYDASIHIKSDQRLPFNQNGIQVEFLIFDSK